MKPYMQNLDTLYTDATCYESEMRYPTDPKLLWEGIEKSYETRCKLSKRLRIHRPRTKFIDVQKANLAYGNVTAFHKNINEPRKDMLPKRGRKGGSFYKADVDARSADTNFSKPAYWYTEEN